MLYDADLATIKASCCVTSLQKLTFRNSILQIHLGGLSAWCALKKIGYQQPSILAQEVQLALQSISNQVTQVPTDVSALSCLAGTLCRLCNVKLSGLLLLLDRFVQSLFGFTYRP